MPTNLDGPIHQKAKLDIVIRNTCANVSIVLTKVHNLQVEVSQLRAELCNTQTTLHTATQVLLRLIADPDVKEHAEAVIRDHFNQRDQNK